MQERKQTQDAEDGKKRNRKDRYGNSLGLYYAMVVTVRGARPAGDMTMDEIEGIVGSAKKLRKSPACWMYKNRRGLSI
jgi:hypothetical protein